MIQIIQSVGIVILLLSIFIIWGYSIAKWLSLRIPHLPMQLLIGFFGFFIVMECIILPVVFLKNSLKLATILCISAVFLITGVMLAMHKISFLKNVREIKNGIWLIVAGVVTVIMVGTSVLQQYVGYDTTYYVGEMAAFVSSDKFWMKDACRGLEYQPTVPLHYALSCFYPMFSILAYVFHVSARIVAMYVARGLCVFLFGQVTFCWGYELFEQNKINGYIFSIICYVLVLFTMDNHSLAFMMMVRGYESKGYCAAIVAPMCTLALIKLCKDYRDKMSWHLLGIVTWASMPIAMSSMAILPAAIGCVGLALMICHKEIKYIFLRCLICVLPNVVLMAWYLLGSKYPMAWR